MTSLLLSTTVMAQGSALRLTRYRKREETAALGGWTGPADPIRLNDGRYLRLLVSLYLDAETEDLRLKVRDSSYQYQVDTEGDQWIFRYDYLRKPGPNPHPAAHVQVRADMIEGAVLPPSRPLSRIHFPTSRVSLESVIRLLADEFGVPCNQNEDVWRALLSESEAAFLKIAHQPLSGPDR